MIAFTSCLPLPHRGSFTASFRPAPLTRTSRPHSARVFPRAALRSGLGLRSRVERIARDIRTVAVVQPELTLPSTLAPTDIKHVSVLRLVAQRLVIFARKLRVFRERHARAVGIARLALGALIGFAVLAARGGRGFALAGTSGTSVAAAPASANAIPSMLSVLPDGVVRTLRPFSESFGVVFLSEFGDKSMFATALMAMKHSPFLVLIGALAALTVMTLIACFLGQLMHLLPSTVTHYSSIALFVFFGLQMIMQARHLPATPGGKGGERADAEELVAESALGGGGGLKQNAFSTLAKISSLIFVAEWCDRSMIATMALAASSNSLAVVGGATLANVVCTGFAVGAAALVASRISERTVALIAGVMFEFFAVFTFLEGPES